MADIGSTLREARMRARIDITEVETRTKIRAKYLRALENEEWNLLPGPTFVKSFLRTYAQALGLDGKLLVEEYRLSHERPSEAELQPIVSTPHSRQRPVNARSGPSRGYLLAVGGVGLVIVLLVVGLLSGGGGGSSKQASHPSTGQGAGASTASSGGRAHRHAGGVSGSSGSGAGAGAASGSGVAGRSLTGAGTGLVAVSLKPSAPVYVCLIGDNGRKVIPGLILKPGAPSPVYHARRFTITLGNSSVRLLVDGTPRAVPPSSRAIGYSITRASGRRTLRAAQQPTCR